MPHIFLNQLRSHVKKIGSPSECLQPVLILPFWNINPSISPPLHIQSRFSTAHMIESSTQILNSVGLQGCVLFECSAPSSPALQSPVALQVLLSCCTCLLRLTFLFACFLPCLLACGTLVPWPRTEPISPTVEAQSPVTGPTGYSLHFPSYLECPSYLIF